MKNSKCKFKNIDNLLGILCRWQEGRCSLLPQASNEMALRPQPTIFQFNFYILNFEMSYWD